MTHGVKEYLIFPEDVGIYGVMAGAAAVMKGTTQHAGEGKRRD